MRCAPRMDTDPGRGRRLEGIGQRMSAIPAGKEARESSPAPCNWSNLAAAGFPPRRSAHPLVITRRASLDVFPRASRAVARIEFKGQTSSTVGFPHLLHQPSDLLIQILPHTLNGGERYEIVFQLEPLDLVGPKVSFNRIGLKDQVEKFLGARTRSVPIRVFDRNQVRELWVHSEGEPYREMKVKTDLYKRPLRTVRDRFRFRTLKKHERVFVKATDGLGNTSVHSTQFRRISAPGSDFKPGPESSGRS